MHTDKPAAKVKLSWDHLSLGLIALFAVLQAVQWQVLPRFMDMYYHLSVANGFSMAGGYVTEAFWEYAPEGRPHLYPPLLHFLLLGIHGLGLSWISVGRLVECCLFPAFLLTLWTVIRRINSPGVAFFTTVAASSVFSLYLDVGILAPFTIALILGLLAVLALEKGRPVSGAVLLALAFYTHLFMAFMCFAAVLAYSALIPGLRRRGFLACAASLLLALPVLVYIAGNAIFFTVLKVREARTLEIYPILILLAAAGLVIALRRRGTYLLPVCLVLAMIPLLFTHTVRSVGGHGLAGLAWLAGIAMYEACAWIVKNGEGRKRRIATIAFAAVLLLAFFSPVLHVNTRDRTVRVRYFDWAIANLVMPESVRIARAKEFTIYFPRQYAEIADLVARNTKKDDIIWSDFSYGGGIIALLSERATASAMMLEVQPYGGVENPGSAKVLIWFKSEIEDVRRRMIPWVEKFDLQPIAETELAYVWLNPAVCPKIKIPQPLVGREAVGVLLLLVLAVLLLDTVGRKLGEDVKGTGRARRVAWTDWESPDED